MQLHTWRQSKAGSRIFKFFVSNASRRGFRASSTSAPSKVYPAFAKAVVMVPLTPVGLLTCSVSPTLCEAVLDPSGSVPVFSAPVSVSRELQVKEKRKIIGHQ